VNWDLGFKLNWERRCFQSLSQYRPFDDLCPLTVLIWYNETYGKRESHTSPTTVSRHDTAITSRTAVLSLGSTEGSLKFEKNYIFIFTKLYKKFDFSFYDECRQQCNKCPPDSKSVLLACLFLARQPPVGQGFLIHEVSRSHTTTHHIPYDSSERVISSSQRPLPDNTQQTNVHATGGIRTHNLSRREAADLRLRTARPLGPATMRVIFNKSEYVKLL